MPGAPLIDTTMTLVPNLIDTSEKTFYPQRIELQHQQLRHLLKTTDSGFTYYASRNQVYALRDGKRKLIATVDFNIQCLTAGFGWLCLGGHEKGRCAFIRLQMGDQNDDPTYNNAEVDTSLSSNIRALARADSPEGLRRVKSTSSRAFPLTARTINYQTIGDQIVNAITIQVMKPEENQELSNKEFVVAVVATNDNLITVFSLDRMLTLSTISFKNAMNHASLYSNGKLLLACGDTNKAFFYKRPGRGLRLDDSGLPVWPRDMQWKLVAAPTIPQFSKDDHCFTTAFSPDGKICTVASQAGLMVQFDVRAIHADMKDGEGIVNDFTCSRPAPLTGVSTYQWRGAIRSTAFSPSIWAMYAWAESRGRITVRDLRNPHRPGQVIYLSEKSPENNTVELVDAARDDIYGDCESLVQSNLRFPRGPRPTSQEIRDELATLDDGLGPAHDTQSQRRSHPYQEIMSFNERSSTPRADDPPPRLQDLMNQIREMGEELEQGTHEESARALPLPPRRRSSIIFGQRESSTTGSGTLVPTHSTPLSASPGRIHRERTPVSMTPPNASTSTSSTGPFTPPAPGSLDAWQTISAAMRNQGAPSRRASLEASLRNLRETRDSLQREQRQSRIRAEAMSREMAREREAQRTSRALNSLTVNGSNATATTSTSIYPSPRREPYPFTRHSLEDSLEISQGRLIQLERELENLDRQTRAYVPGTSTGPEVLHGVTPQAATAMMAALESETERYQGLRRVNSRPLMPFYDDGVGDDEPEILGLDWSHDGRILFVATNVGIFELKANLSGRKTFAAPIRPR